MKPARLLLLLVAIVAGGLAAFLATRGQAPVVVPGEIISQVREETRTQVLVAASAIGVGQRLNASLVEWQDWPEGALRAEYLTSAALPDAPQQMEGAVARFEIFIGEPIRTERLVRSDQGYLSAVLAQGMRGVSIGVTAESGAGGFIVPNDRVDVVQTVRGAAGNSSETILSNVKVLAIGLRLGQINNNTEGASPPETGPNAETFTAPTIATLELNPVQAETIISAAAVGDLSLVLRSITDFDQQPGEEPLRRSSQAIRLIRFGAEINVQSGTTQSGNSNLPPVQTQPQTQPVAYVQPDLVQIGVPSATLASTPSQLAPAEPQFVPDPPVTPLQ